MKYLYRPYHPWRHRFRRERIRKWMMRILWSIFFSGAVLVMKANVHIKVTEKLIQETAAVHQIGKGDNSGSQADIQHQIGNAFVPVFETEALKAAPQIFQITQLLKRYVPILSANGGKVYNRFVNIPKEKGRIHP